MNGCDFSVESPVCQYQNQILSLAEVKFVAELNIVRGNGRKAARGKKNILCNWYTNQLIGLKVIGLTVLLINPRGILTQNL
jgi:hypothetical protein